MIFQHPLPDDWQFVLATPHAAPGLSGPTEKRAFRDLAPMDAERVGRICRLTLMQVAPAVLTGDIRGLRSGDHRDPGGGGRVLRALSGRPLRDRDRLRGRPSSPGRAAPTGSGRAPGGRRYSRWSTARRAARALADTLRRAFRDRLAWVDVSRARNEGASCREIS